MPKPINTEIPRLQDELARVMGVRPGYEVMCAIQTIGGYTGTMPLEEKIAWLKAQIATQASK